MNYKKDLFEGVAKKQVKQSRFNLSHEQKHFMLPGLLTPVLLMEVMPTDKIEIESTFMFRFDPMHYPIAHIVDMRCDYFYVAWRILWRDMGPTNSGWSKWISMQNEQAVPILSVDITYFDDRPNRGISKHFGLPLIPAGITGVTDPPTINVSAGPFSAMLKIWDDWYRIPQLEDEKWFPLNAGDNSDLMHDAYDITQEADHFYGLLAGYWERDYFTSGIPTAQAGDVIKIPLSANDGSGQFWVDQTTGERYAGADAVLWTEDGTSGTQTAAGTDLRLESGGTVPDLRKATIMQQFRETVMKIGNRTRDYIKGLWGRDPEPGVLDMAVMFHTVFGQVQVADVMTTADTANGSDQVVGTTGNYRGQMNLFTKGKKGSYYCPDHGFIMAILHVVPNTSYGNGIARMWTREVQTDYPLDMFMHIGDQEVLKEEVSYNPFSAQSAKNKETFSYIPRGSEMKYINNIHTGDLAYQANRSMHLGRMWDAETTTGNTYDTEIEISARFVQSRIADLGGIRVTNVWRSLPVLFNETVPTQCTILAHIFHSIYANRQIPIYSTPKMM